MNVSNEAEDWIRCLGLEPHPEGGYFSRAYPPLSPEPRRGELSSIHYLVTADRPSRWHRLRDATEIWFFHGGAPLELSIVEPNGDARVLRLGLDVAGGEVPQGAVPAAAWQTARTLGRWTLVGCAVAPAFSFSAFELAPEGWHPTG